MVVPDPIEPTQPTGRAARPYRSTVRVQRAEDTRRRIAAAACELFAEHGFAGTTMANIAAQAGVAAPTVYAAFGSKGAIVRALLTQMEQDADSASWARRIDQETDPQSKLAMFATWTTTLLSASKSAIVAASGAAADPAVTGMRDEGNRRRREGLRTVIASLGNLKVLTAGLSEEHALDQAWMLTSVELYLCATDGCGWTDTDYERWLAALLQHQLLNC